MYGGWAGSLIELSDTASTAVRYMPVQFVIIINLNLYVTQYFKYLNKAIIYFIDSAAVSSN